MEGARVYGDALRRIADAGMQISHRYLCEPLGKAGMSPADIVAQLGSVWGELSRVSIETVRHLYLDFLIDAAAEAGSYKPAHGHWERFFARYDVSPESHVHVAASLYHDIEPAGRLGLKAVWINRLHEESDLPRAAELKDLSRLPDVLDELVPVATVLE